jgi:hypothetical protein
LNLAYLKPFLNSFCGKHISFVIFVLGNFFFFNVTAPQYCDLENSIIMAALWVADEGRFKGEVERQAITAIP